MSAPNGNGNGDWAASFAAFYDRHRDKDRKKLKFTGVFNAHLECLIDEPELPVEWRCLAWSLRQSWGNNSDFCVDRMGGERVGQKECASRLGVKKQRVSDAFLYLKGLYYIESSKGYAVFPVDNPSERRAKSPAPSGLSDTQITQFQAWCDDWRVRYLADSQELESAEETVNRIKKVRLGLYRESVRVARKRDEGDGTPLTTTLQHVEQTSSSSSALPCSLKQKAEEEESDLFHIFKTEYPAGHFDAPNAKPSFDGKTKAEQLHAIERLRVYKKSERWKDDDGSWIPFASKWLASAYGEEPPPVVKKKSRTASAGNGSGEESYFERRVREEREGSNG